MRILRFAAPAMGLGALTVSCSLINAPAPIKGGTGGSGGVTTCTMPSDCQPPGVATACQVADCQGGECTTRPADDGTPCDDGKFCSAAMSGTCQSGACQGVQPKVCPSLGACQVSDCNEAAKSCTAKMAPDGTHCGPGPDACSDPAICQMGACVMPPKKCESQTTDCLDVVCNTTSKTCASTPKNAGMACDTNAQCRYAGTCTAAGICSGGNKPDKTVCDDGRACTLGDICTAGKCAGVSICPADGPCAKYTCTEPTAACTRVAENDGMACTINSCTTGSTCGAGVCSGGTPSASILFHEDFHDNSKNWQLDSEWQIGPAMASTPNAAGALFPGTQDPPYDHTRGNDNGVAGVALGGNEDTGATATIPRTECLVSPTIDTSNANGTLNLTYYRWLNSDYPPYMTDTVDVSSDGGATWAKNCYMNPVSPNPAIDTPNVGGGGWTLQTCEITGEKSTTMKIRFCFSVGDPQVASVGSWNIDDVIVSDSGQTCI